MCQLKLQLDLKNNELKKTNVLLKSCTKKIQDLNSDMDYLKIHLKRVRDFIAEFFLKLDNDKLALKSELMADLDKFELLETKLLNRQNTTRTELSAMELEHNKINADIITLNYEIEQLSIKHKSAYEHWYAITRD